MPRLPTPKHSGLSEAVGAFLVGTLLSGIGLQIAAAAVGYHQGKNEPVPLAVTMLGLTGLWIGLIGGVVLYSRFRGSGDLRADLGLYFRWPFDAVVGIVVGVGTQLALIPLLYWPFEQADPTLRHRLEAPAKTDTAAIHGALQISLLVLFLAVGAPIVEELFFRGLLLRSLARWLGPIPGVIGSALVFGLAHFEPLQLAALVLFGLILGVLAHKTGRLGPGIVAHAAFNAVTVLTLTMRR
ncbi:MAG: protease family protein [Acidimicrobiaceae bacterium]|nr:protease family protein [Acidimicrobiaceae bacterium]MDQ1364274.1 protease family protein [Acidimicrobiaceae bacterium]MDQ1376363.1 protease family protein [Acidimicrobiaceae bacterium]MDQ1411732.1 protease family protein [Acidimicrobiaceae bacterium]MDQ1415745.1 protease family protein [Acidimicrobiaceae bacterium]